MQASPPLRWSGKILIRTRVSFKEEIIYEKTVKGIYEKHAYISAYVNEVEVRVFCKYAVKEGSKNVPGLMNTHGWMGGPSIDKQYVNDGWAVISHDYSGLTKRPHHTKYPPELGHGHMDAKEKGYTLIYDKMPDGSQTTDPKATSHYLWNAIQRRVLSYLLTQKEVDPSRIGAKGYSYGGTIMWNLAMDKRVKAVVAYFGIGWINYYRDRAIWKFDQPQKEIPQTPGQKLFLTGLAPQAHAPYIQAASLWLNGSNDHHGGHERGCDTFKDFKPGVPWDFAVQARGHHNTEKLGDNCKVWLEKHVRGDSHIWPARPTSEIKLGQDGVPELHLSPANSEKIKEVQVYQCVKTANNIARFWRDVRVQTELVTNGSRSCLCLTPRITCFHTPIFVMKITRSYLQISKQLYPPTLAGQWPPINHPRNCPEGPVFGKMRPQLKGLAAFRGFAHLTNTMEPPVLSLVTPNGKLPRVRISNLCFIAPNPKA